MDYRKVNDEVLYPNERFATLDAAGMEFLKREALKNPRKRIRFCSHQGMDEKIHEMFIVHAKDAYVRPHKHINKSESLYLIEGEVDVIFLDDDGQIIKKVEMGPMASGKLFYYRLTDPIYHTFYIKSDLICFYEVTQGPFNREDTIFPSWAPDGSDPSHVVKFMDSLNTKGD